MPGLTDLSALLADMSPVLHPDTLVFATTPDRALGRAAAALMRFEEAEGTTLILAPDEALRLGLGSIFPCRMITLNVASSLDAVGFMAAVTAELARLGIGTNPVAGYFHDHLFVAGAQADAALAALLALVRQGGG